jgi:hypothetical protein
MILFIRFGSNPSPLDISSITLIEMVQENDGSNFSLDDMKTVTSLGYVYLPFMVSGAASKIPTSYFVWSIFRCAICSSYNDLS